MTVVTQTLTVRAPVELVEEIDGAADASGANRTDVVLEALRAYLYRRACERDAEILAADPIDEDEFIYPIDPRVLADVPWDADTGEASTDTAVDATVGAVDAAW